MVKINLCKDIMEHANFLVKDKRKIFIIMLKLEKKYSNPSPFCIMLNHPDNTKLIMLHDESLLDNITLSIDYL